MPEDLFFQAPEELDVYFREGREFFNESYVKKLAQTSSWFTRMKSATWPMNSGTTQKGFRFGRGFFDPTRPWRKIVSERCETDSCDSLEERIVRPATDSYFFDLLRKEMRTDWICVEDLMYRLLPADEIAQMEASHAIITRSVHEEFSRTTYVGASGHKWGGLVNEDNEYCTPTDDAFFTMGTYNGVGQGGFDSRYIYVKCAWADLADIAYLSLDMLDDTLVDLADEDEAYRVDLRDAGILKLDIIVPSPNVARRLFVQAKEANGFWGANAEFDHNLTDLRLGIHRIIGDYAFGYDNNSLRYNEDTAFNGASGASLASFNAAVPPVWNADGTVTNAGGWPRLIRVNRYIEEVGELGYSYVPNSAYRTADFGISVCFMEEAMKKWMNPNNTGYGSVRMQDQNYAGDFEWRRPDWPENPRMKSGFFQAQFRLAMQVKDPTIMHSYLHRLDHSKKLSTSACALQTYTAPAPIDPYVCQGVQA